MMHQMFSIGKRSGLQAGQFSTRTLLLRSHAVLIAAVCGFALSCWNTHHLLGSICWSKTASGPWSHMASTADCLYGQWFLEVFLGPFSNVNDRIMSMNYDVSSVSSVSGLKTTGIQQRSSALSLTHRYFYSFSELFDDVMLFRWWDLQSLCSLILGNVVFLK